MLFETLAETSERISVTTKKKEKVAHLVHLLRQTQGSDIALAASYLSGRLPQGRLGIGWTMLQDAVRDLPQGHSVGQPSLGDVNATLEAIASESGMGSIQRKMSLLRELLAHMEQRERRFLTNLVIGEIRQGALGGFVVEAIAQAAALPREKIGLALMFSGDIGEVARTALEKGDEGLSRFGAKLFHPISPMLASSVDDEEAALQRLGEAGWEYKLDGARIQVHRGGEEVRIFSRHLKDVTESLPEIVELVRTFPTEEAIIEGEVVALSEDGRSLPFQTTMRRFGRIQDIERMQREITLAPYFFDLLYADGTSLLQAAYRERFALLTERVAPGYVMPRIVTGDEQEAQEFLRQSLEAGHEGVMAKGLDSPYVAGQRGFLWLKIKPAQTVDLVVLAAEWGHGRRRGWLSNLHLGARGPEQNSFVMVGKTFKGLTDDMLRWQTHKLFELEIARDEWTVYVRPELIVEIAFNDIQRSPRYPGGLALRFARVRRYREDKSPLEADTIATIRAIFEARRGL